MKFPWYKYEEIPSYRKNTLQIFLTSKCNLKCNGCFARNIGGNNQEISLSEYNSIISNFLKKDGKQINFLGGEPLLHSKIKEFVKINEEKNIKTTIYTNGYFLDKFNKDDFKNSKLRVSLYCKSGGIKSAEKLKRTEMPLEVCYMTSKSTILEELLGSAKIIEENYNSNVFFISSIRELDNPHQEFFEDTNLTMPVMDYKRLVHKFLDNYEGNMEIHVSKRGVFESTKTISGNKCKFANYFPGGKIIQCPYDTVNLKFQKDYEFDIRNCQHNNSCLMSKVIYKRKI